MKEYKVQAIQINKNDDKWYDVGEYFCSLEEAKLRIKYEEYLDTYCENEEWVYRILTREVSGWEIL